MNRAGIEPDPAKRLRRYWGSRIRRQRQILGMTQRQLADRLEELGLSLTPQAIGQWELGHSSPKSHHQRLIARALDVPHAYLFAMTDEDAAA